jgi:hypothetical protein
MTKFRHKNLKEFYAAPRLYKDYYTKLLIKNNRGCDYLFTQNLESLSSTYGQYISKTQTETNFPIALRDIISADSLNWMQSLFDNLKEGDWILENERANNADSRRVEKLVSSWMSNYEQLRNMYTITRDMIYILGINFFGSEASEKLIAEANEVMEQQSNDFEGILLDHYIAASFQDRPEQLVENALNMAIRLCICVADLNHKKIILGDMHPSVSRLYLCVSNHVNVWETDFVGLFVKLSKTNKFKYIDVEKLLLSNFGDAGTPFFGITGKTSNVLPCLVKEIPEEFKETDHQAKRWIIDQSSLINEALIESESSIPWGAIIQFEIGPFKYFRLFQHHHGIRAVWFDSQAKHSYHQELRFSQETKTNDKMFVQKNVQRPVNMVFDNLNDLYGFLFENSHTPVTAAAVNFDAYLGFLVACAVRDFLVVEYRQMKTQLATRIFNNKVTSNMQSFGLTKIVYLPKVKYVSDPDSGKKVQEVLSKRQIKKAAHYRIAHLRRLPKGQKVNPEQVFLAEALGRNVPDGHTWVSKAHVTGLSSDKLYRSKTMTDYLIDSEVKHIQKGQKEIKDWRMFESHCKKYLSSKGWKILKVERKGPGDGGLDIWAIKGNERLVADAKFYLKAVPPVWVRSIHGVKTEMGVDHAWLMISSYVSDQTKELALKLDVKIVDGTLLFPS